LRTSSHLDCIRRLDGQGGTHPAPPPREPHPGRGRVDAENAGRVGSAEAVEVHELDELSFGRWERVEGLASGCRKRAASIRASSRAWSSSSSSSRPETAATIP
jgi:hypothetical protein